MRRKSLDTDQQIEEATDRLATLDRRLANLQRLRPAVARSAGTPRPTRPGSDGTP
jgi:hypothetical protein